MRSTSPRSSPRSNGPPRRRPHRLHRLRPPRPRCRAARGFRSPPARDPKALAFDWRKLTKDEPKLLGKRSAFTAPWGQTRRLVTGPFDSAKAATQFVSELKKAGIDAFVFTSDEGEEVAPLR